METCWLCKEANQDSIEWVYLVGWSRPQADDCMGTWPTGRMPQNKQYTEGHKYDK